VVSDKEKMPGKKWLGLLAVCVLVIVLAAIAWAVRLADVHAKDAAAKKEVQNRLAALRQAGQPISFQDLAARYPDPPPEHDAELLLKPAVTALVEPNYSEKLPFFGGNWPASDTPLSPQLLASMRATLEKNKNALELVPEDELKFAWVGCGYANGFTNQPKISLSKIHSLADLLCLDAVSKGVTGDSSGATKSLEKAAFVVRALKNDTYLHGMLRAFLCDHVCESLNQILNRADMADSDLKAISDLLPMTDGGFVKELYINERCFGISEAENFKSMADRIAIRHESLGRIIYQDQDMLNLLDVADSNLAALDSPLSNAIPKLVAFETQRKAEDARFETRNSGIFGRLFKKRIPFTSIVVLPNSSSTLIAGTKRVAYERAALAAIAVELYRFSHAGRLPENLSALVPEYLASVPKDPFDDHDLRFKKLEHGFAVYSIGPDFTDDNGEPEPKDAENVKHYDVVFSVMR
jgi:hypothetical protein